MVGVTPQRANIYSCRHGKRNCGTLWHLWNSGYWFIHVRPLSYDLTICSRHAKHDVIKCVMAPEDSPNPLRMFWMSTKTSENALEANQNICECSQNSVEHSVRNMVILFWNLSPLMKFYFWVFRIVQYGVGRTKRGKVTHSERKIRNFNSNLRLATHYLFHW